MTLPITDQEMSTYLSGEVLYGDDFADQAIAQWFEDEREGYANLPWEDPDDTGGPENYWYGELNTFHGFRHLPDDIRFRHVLGLGSAYGGEFFPILRRIDKLTIVEPSLKLRSANLHELIPTYVDPQASGELPFAEATFDLAVMFGVLHHIPNVSKVLSEAGRCLEPGGWLILREPVISMGDWRYPRTGLTKRERGIPRDLLISALQQSNFEVRRAAPCMNPAIGRAAHYWSALGPDHTIGTLLDALVCRILQPNYRYHATNTRHKLRPTSVSIVAQKKN